MSTAERPEPDRSSTPSETSPWPEKPAELRAALRRARIADAERSGAIYDLRAADLARLELLEETVQPIFAALPAAAELFEPGLLPSERPRFFIDAVAFVELARDHRTYRLLLDTLEGRIVLGESVDPEVMRRYVGDHVARRLLAREKALASSAYPPGMLAQAGSVRSDPLTAAIAMPAPDDPRPRRPGIARRLLGATAVFMLGLVLGALALAAWLVLKGRL